jgi:hypothetical protein
MANLTFTTFFILITVLISSCLPQVNALEISSPPKIYAQSSMTINITSDSPFTLRDVYFEELYLGNTTYYSATNESVALDNMSLKWAVSYQLVGKDTDRLKVTVFYFVGVDLLSFTQYFYVFPAPPPPKEITYFAIGFVVFVVALGSFWTYKYIKRRLW